LHGPAARRTLRGIMMRNPLLYSVSGLVLFASILPVAPVRLFANAGVFAGSGYNIKLVKNDDIRMTREDVTITPVRGRVPFDGGLPGMDRVDYACVFVLKNLRDAPVSVQVGFPINTQYVEPLPSPVPGATKLDRAMWHYRFIAHDGTQTYAVRHTPADGEEKFRNLFVWDMAFAAGETKTLRVAYQVPMSMGLASSNHRVGTPSPGPASHPEWQNALTECSIEFFGYVTRTGASWAGGSIEHATFTLRLKDFERYLADRPLFGANGQAAERWGTRLPPATVRILSPAPGEWTPAGNGNLVRKIKNYRPEEDITVMYYLMAFPQTAAETEQLVARLGESSKHDKRTDAAVDLEGLRDIFREFNGGQTGNPGIEAFVSEQVWRGVRPLRGVPDDVFKTIEQLRARTAANTADRP
jgi:hypothetical protein